jgi:uncharacterized protein
MPLALRAKITVLAIAVAPAACTPPTPSQSVPNQSPSAKAVAAAGSGDNVRTEPEDSKTCEVEMTDEKLVVTPDPAAEIQSGALRFGVSVRNGAPKAVGVRYDRSLAYPGAKWLSLTLRGPIQGADYRSLAGPEIYALMGKVETEKACIPAGGALRVTSDIPLSRLRYFGEPEATLEWSLTLNGVEHHGEVKVTLPRRESLALAIEFADVATVKRLLSSGADARERDDYGRTALELTLDGGHRQGGLVSTMNEETHQIVALLLDHGAPLAGALVRAGATDDEGLLSLLLSRGADINETNKEGDTALHGAFRVTPPRREIVRFLIERGANPHAKNRAGKTPLDLADEATKAFMLGIRRVGP